MSINLCYSVLQYTNRGPMPRATARVGPRRLSAHVSIRVNAVKSGLYVDLDDTVMSRNCDFTKIRLPVTISSIFHPKEIL
jgi:hypothetical protein